MKNTKKDNRTKLQKRFTLTKTQKYNTMESYIGKKVKIIGDHPHAGEIGVGVSFDIIKSCANPGLLINNDRGLQYRVFDSNEIELILTNN